MWSVVMLGRGVEKREPALLPCSSFSPLCRGGSKLPSAPQSPCQAGLNIPLSPCGLLVLDPVAWPYLKPWLQLWLPVV